MSRLIAGIVRSLMAAVPGNRGRFSYPTGAARCGGWSLAVSAPDAISVTDAMQTALPAQLPPFIRPGSAAT